jgi:hypothetical protein
VTDTFIATFKRRRSVSKPIAADTWTFTDSKGRKRLARIEIGRPQRVPEDKNHDWHCPVFIEGWTPHVIPAMGIGPIDSLMNAVTLVRSFHEHIAAQQITFGTSKPRRSRRRGATRSKQWH